jgi:hypothetical protein
MEIKPSSGHSPIPPVPARPPSRAAAAQAEGGDFTGAAALQSALDATPDVRPEAVARGQALVADTHYPPAVTLQRLARLFAIEFGAQKPPTTQS